MFFVFPKNKSLLSWNEVSMAEIEAFGRRLPNAPFRTQAPRVVAMMLGIIFVPVDLNEAKRDVREGFIQAASAYGRAFAVRRLQPSCARLSFPK